MLDTSDQLSDVCCWEDADGASQLAEPPAVRLTVMHLDDVTCRQHINDQRPTKQTAEGERHTRLNRLTIDI